MNAVKFNTKLTITYHFSYYLVFFDCLCFPFIEGWCHTHKKSCFNQREKHFRNISNCIGLFLLDNRRDCEKTKEKKNMLNTRDAGCL